MKASGRVEEVMRQLETALLDGSYPANARLPGERVLAEQYAVSRNTVREATQRLAARGLLRSRQGAGVYVTDQLRTTVASPWGQLVSDHPAVLNDVLEFRRVLEGATAYFAALRGNDDEHQQIRASLGALEQARAENNHAEEAVADAKLHETIALASHNSMFLHLHASVLAILREHIQGNGSSLRAMEDDASGRLLQQHKDICEAICARTPDAARNAMQAHIDFVASRMD